MYNSHIKISCLIQVIMFSGALFAQSVSIIGTVTDEFGNGLAGANVSLEGTTQGAATTKNGSYEIANVTPGSYTVIASYIGYKSRAKNVIVDDNGTIANFILPASSLGLPMITVSATKREEALQDVPQSISVQTGASLEMREAKDLRDYIGSVPGVNLVSASPSVNNLSIRGITSIHGWASTVSYYIDETPITVRWRAYPTQSFDVERVEVLKGPQGTLYGEGSMGGTIRIITTKPYLSGFQAKVNPVFSSTENGGNNKTINAMVNIPLIKNKIGIRAIGFLQENDGWIKNIGNNYNPMTEKVESGEKVNNYKTLGGRIQLRFLPSKNMDMLASVSLGKNESGFTSTANENLEDYTGSRQVSNDEYSLYNLTFSYSMPWANLTISGSNYKRTFDRVIDYGFVLPFLDQIFGQFGFPPFSAAWTVDNELHEILTGEARLVSTGGGPLQWTLGAFYKKYEKTWIFDADSKEHIPSDVVNAFGQYFNVNITDVYATRDTMETAQTAVFGEVSYKLTPNLNLTVGLRFFNESRFANSWNGGLFPLLLVGVPEMGVDLSEKASVVNPKLTIGYRASDNILTYATVAGGFRSGGENIFYEFFPGVAISYKPEKLMNQELGIKSSWLNNRLTANGSLYYNKWTDMQVQSRAFQTQAAIENVGEAHTSGFEGEVIWLVSKGLEISFGGTWIDAKTDIDLALPMGDDSSYTNVPSGTQLPNVPESSYDFGAQYSLPITSKLNITGGVDYSYTESSFHTLLSPATGEAQSNQAYSNLNLRLAVQSGFWEASAFVHNAADVRSMQQFQYENAEVGKVYSISPPRTIGLGLRLKF